MHFNLTLPSFDGMSEQSSIEQIKGYLTVLNEQLRYMMLNIDEDNLSDSLSNTVGNVAELSRLIDSVDKRVGVLEERLLHATQKLTDVENKTARLSLNENGSLILDTGLGETPLSFGVTTGDGVYIFTVYNKNGHELGSVEVIP